MGVGEGVSTTGSGAGVLSGTGVDERSEEVWTGVGVGVGAAVSGAGVGAGVVSGVELVVGGALLLLVVVTGVGRSVPVLLSGVVSVSTPDSEWGVSVPSVTVGVELPVVSVPLVLSLVVVPSDVVFSGRPDGVARGLPPVFEDVLEPGVELPEVVLLGVGVPDPVVLVFVLGGTTVLLDPFATGTPVAGAGVEVSWVSELLVCGVPFCWSVPCGSVVVFGSGCSCSWSCPCVPVGEWVVVVGVLVPDVPVGLVDPCGTLLWRSPPSTFTSSRCGSVMCVSTSLDSVDGVFVIVRGGLPVVGDELPLFDVVLMLPGPDVVDGSDDGPFVEESLPGPGLVWELELVSESVSSGMSAVPSVFTGAGVLKLNLLPNAPAPWPRWRSLIELRPLPRKVFSGSMGKPKMDAVAISPSVSAPPSVRKCSKSSPISCFTLSPKVFGLGVGVGFGFGVMCGVGVGLGVGFGFGVGVGFGLGVGVGFGFGLVLRSGLSNLWLSNFFPLPLMSLNGLWLLKMFLKLFFRFLPRSCSSPWNSPVNAPKTPSWMICDQSNPCGRRPLGAPSIMASRTAKVVNASSIASVRLGRRCVFFISHSISVRMATRLRAFATAAWLEAEPPVKADSTAMMSNSMSSRTSSAMICHFDSMMSMEDLVRDCPMPSSWSANSFR